MASDSTTQLQLLVVRANTGDAAANEELIARACRRLRLLTRKLLHDNPRIRRFEDSADVLQNCLLRLHRRLKAVPLQTVSDFFRLAAREIRLEIITLARHYYGPRGDGTHQLPAGQAAMTDSSVQPPPVAEADSDCDPARLAWWTEFHERVERLPAAHRALVDLLWYHGMTYEEAAGILGISVATLKRNWMATRLRLQEFLGQEEPGSP